MDSPSAQLAMDLRVSVQRSLATRRPLLHHLSADSSWLLQLPLSDVAASRPGARQYYNILVDPWLSGTQIDIAGWFSTQWHAEPPAVSSIAQVEELCRETEILSAGLRLGKARIPNGLDTGSDVETLIGAVVISHEFTDHCHKSTLLQLHADTPVFAAKKAAASIRCWKYFRTVEDIAVFALAADAAKGVKADWRDTSMYPLPSWIGISRLEDPTDPVNLHSAIMISFSLDRASHKLSNGRRKEHPAEDAEAFIYTPHGIKPTALQAVVEADPPLKTLALLHGLQNVTITAQQINLGAHNGLKAQRMLGATYWVGTHDELKKGKGLINWLLSRKMLTVKDAVEAEAAKLPQTEGDARKEAHYIDLKNGESMLLE